MFSICVRPGRFIRLFQVTDTGVSGYSTEDIVKRTSSNRCYAELLRSSPRIACRIFAAQISVPCRPEAGPIPVHLPASQTAYVRRVQEKAARLRLRLEENGSCDEIGMTLYTDYDDAGTIMRSAMYTYDTQTVTPGFLWTP